MSSSPISSHFLLRQRDTPENATEGEREREREKGGRDCCCVQHCCHLAAAWLSGKTAWWREERKRGSERKRREKRRTRAAAAAAWQEGTGKNKGCTELAFSSCAREKEPHIRPLLHALTFLSSGPKCSPVEEDAWGSNKRQAEQGDVKGRCRHGCQEGEIRRATKHGTERAEGVPRGQHRGTHPGAVQPSETEVPDQPGRADRRREEDATLWAQMVRRHEQSCLGTPEDGQAQTGSWRRGGGLPTLSKPVQIRPLPLPGQTQDIHPARGTWRLGKGPKSDPSRPIRGSKTLEQDVRWLQVRRRYPVQQSQSQREEEPAAGCSGDPEAKGQGEEGGDKPFLKVDPELVVTVLGDLEQLLFSQMLGEYGFFRFHAHLLPAAVGYWMAWIDWKISNRAHAVVILKVVSDSWTMQGFVLGSMCLVHLPSLALVG